MLYKNKFYLLGTPAQIAIVKEALDKIMFPWDKLKLPYGTANIGWRDLNPGATYLESKSTQYRSHMSGTKGVINGREYILGIFYTHEGHIYIDYRLEQYPEMAQSTVSAEIAHSVDYFLPTFTDAMRDQLIDLAHVNSPHPDEQHTWWEVIDYGTEYFKLIGEAFMQMFTLAYSDMDFDNSSFLHGITKEQAPEVRKILGIERTDWVAPPPPVPATQYETFPPSKVYHKMSHYRNKEGKTVTDITGLRPCKICKP